MKNLLVDALTKQTYFTFCAFDWISNATCIRVTAVCRAGITIVAMEWLGLATADVRITEVDGAGITIVAMKWLEHAIADGRVTCVDSAGITIVAMEWLGHALADVRITEVDGAGITIVAIDRCVLATNLRITGTSGAGITIVAHHHFGLAKAVRITGVNCRHCHHRIGCPWCTPDRMVRSFAIRSLEPLPADFQSGHEQQKAPKRERGMWSNCTLPRFFSKLGAVLVPRPRLNLTRFHGVFAPNSPHRAKDDHARETVNR